MLLLGSIAKGVRSAGGTHIVGTLEALPSSQAGIAAVSNPSVCDTDITLALHFRKMM
jgi:hypothetical protein